MSKHLLVTLMLTCGMPLSGSMTALANPEPQTQQQGVESITGTVYDENNEPVIGATVSANGAKGQGVMTDAFGHFTLRARVGAPITIGYVGYKTVEMPASRDMQIYLQPTTEVLDQLVVVGYGEQKRANLTGAVSTVDVAKTMDSRPASDVAKALQGAVPGLTITSANGSINDAPQINIRGLGTLSNNHTSSPLIVVDGVPVDDLNFINPEDIEDISVLKDAASSSIYGSRAAFGVILVTTKTANRADRVSVKYTNNFGWGNATVLPEYKRTVDQLLTAMDDTNPGGDKEIFSMYFTDILPFARLWAEQHNGPYTGMVTLQPFQDASNVGDYYVFPNPGTFPEGVGVGPMKSSRYLSYADWDVRKTMFHTAFSQKHNVSLEGVAGQTTNYRVSFGYDSREGLLRYNPEQLKRYNANASVDTQIFSFLKGGARVNFSQREFTEPNVQRNSYQYIWRWPSFWENYGYVPDEDGNLKGFYNDATVRMNSQDIATVTTQLRLQGYLDAQIAKGLNLHADFTYALRNQNQQYANVPYSTYYNWLPGANTLGNWNSCTQASSYAQQSNYRDYMWTANVYGTYAHTFAADHNLKVMLGWTAEKEDYRQFQVRRTGLTDYNLPNLNLTNGTTYTTSADAWHRATTGFFGRINYDYKGIYLLEVNGRYDGSSRFPAADQWAFFPSFSAGYRFSEEAYFNPLKSIISNGKIRGSYGHIGNEAVGSNMFLSTVSAATAGNVYWLDGTQKITEFGMPTLVSSTLTWERIETADVGIDLGFLNNSINFSFDWYQRDTKDMLAPGQVLPAVLGASSPYQNAGSLRTRGWELSVGWNQSFGDWDVYVSANLADARTQITKWNNPNNIIYTYLPASYISYTEGMYFGDIWGFETDRYFTEADLNANGTLDYQRWEVNPATGESELVGKVADQSGLQTGTFVYGPGDIKFKDLNGDGKIDGGKGTKDDHGDLKVIGNALPRYEYSFRLGGAWKGFDLDIFFQGVGKRNMWATGSTIIPMSQSALGTFSNLDSYNKVFYTDVTNPETGEVSQEVSGYEIDQNNFYPRMYSGAGGAAGNIQNIGFGMYNFYPQSRYLLNLAYLRIKNLTFGYTLPVDVTRKAMIQRARVYFSVDNLCFLYNGVKKYQLDPEMTTIAGSSIQGYNTHVASFGRTTPLQQTFSFGIQVTL